MTNGKAAPLAVVTGASSGIGYSLATQFAKNGFDLVIVAENLEIHDAARTLAEQGCSVIPVQADLATFDGVEELCREIAATGRPVDSLAINAGVGVSGPFIETDLAAELNLVALNVTSAVHLAKRLLPGMVARGHGRVLFTSSIAGTAPGPFHATYAASKAFLYSLSEAIRNELKDTGVTVTALLPGPTETPFFEKADMLDTRVGASDSKDDPDEVARDGFDALMSGDDHVVAGSAKNKVQAVSGKVLPPTATAQMMRKQTEPGSGD
jgi:short-subunit dehydrogenase